MGPISVQNGPACSKLALRNWGRVLSFFICKFEVNRDCRTRCTNRWSNLTLKFNANPFLKVDSRIEENCNFLSARVFEFLPKASVARNWVTRNMPRIQFVIQEKELLYAECGARLKNFYLSNLLCICPSLFETYLLRKQGKIYYLRKTLKNF